jgi:hypothetical protein
MIVAMLGMAPGAMAQGGTVSVKLNRAEMKGNALNLDADVIIDHIDVGRYESLSLTLWLKGTGRGQTLALPPVIVNGANKRQMYERAVAIHGVAAAKNGAYAVLKSAPELIQFLAYKRAVAYKSWMSNSQLILVGEVKDYHNNTIQSFTKVLEKKLPVRRSAAASATGRPNTSSNTYSMPPATNPAVNPANRPATNPNTRPANSQGTRPATNQSRPATNQNRPATNQSTRPASNQSTRPATNQSRSGTNQSTRPANTQKRSTANTPANKPASGANSGKK